MGLALWYSGLGNVLWKYPYQTIPAKIGSPVPDLLNMESTLLDAAWEALYAPYDQPTYRAVLDQIGEQDITLDIGAGDLRLARQMAVIARKVYAVEINSELLHQACTSDDLLPDNLIFIRADARTMEFPTDITTGVLLMRHCTRFRLYSEKLQKAGASRLITNARWRMGVEVVNLWAQRRSFAEVDMGWFACSCGGTGFKAGPAEYWSFEMDRITNEVSSCPHCMEVPDIKNSQETLRGVYPERRAQGGIMERL